MTRIVLIGYDPDAVDFSDPALPPGLTADKIRAGIEVGLEQIRKRGWEADFCSIRPDDSAGPMVERQLAGSRYDCIVIGGGVRMSQSVVAVFETVLDVVRRTAPNTPVAFNTRPEDSAEAAARWVKAG